ncbi:MAG TPA: hypothetical protein VEK82_17395 [Stellaceae bacterium]|nr:hypothetical protein [Stellaceae bacterium]
MLIRNSRREQRAFFAAKIFGRGAPPRPSAAEILGFTGSLATLARNFAADSLQMQQTQLDGLNRQLSPSANAKSWLQDRGGTLAANGWL